MTENDEKIDHLRNLYGFSYWEAREYLSYEPYDANDWHGTQWEGKEPYNDNISRRSV